MGLLIILLIIIAYATGLISGFVAGVFSQSEKEKRDADSCALSEEETNNLLHALRRENMGEYADSN